MESTFQTEYISAGGELLKAATGQPDPNYVIGHLCAFRMKTAISRVAYALVTGLEVNTTNGECILFVSTPKSFGKELAYLSYAGQTWFVVFGGNDGQQPIDLRLT